MSRTPVKYILFITAAALCFTGCKKEDAGKTQSGVQTEAAVDGEQKDTEETYGIYNYFYTGYEDECTGWSGYEQFVDQDYDNDKLIDRVYKEYKEDTDCCHYRIEFGNGDVIHMDKDVASTGFLDIKTADLNEDGQNEIIISFLYGTSTDMRLSGDFVVYEKRGDTYEKAVLPFRESEEGYRQNVPIRYEVICEERIKISVENDGYETRVPINNEQWDALSYLLYYNDVVHDSVVWDNYLLEKDGKTQLVCKVHLFDKWSDYGLFAVLRHEDGEYVVDRWLRVNDEYDDTIAEDSFWALENYLLCSHTMVAGNQPVSVGLWLEKGEYASEEELVPGGGVYEENFTGEYVLLAVDKEGTILSKRDITQDLDGMGSRLNFPGAFEIMEKDYNQDSCPDFTIGTYGSSSTNIYALYTVSKDGEIELLGRDIPNCSPGVFSVAFEEGADKTFYTNIWDHAVGEEAQVVYEWDEMKKKYREKKSES